MNEEYSLLENIGEENSEKIYNFAIFTTFAFNLNFFENYVMTIKDLPKNTYLLVEQENYDNQIKENQPSNKFLNTFLNKIIKINLIKGVFHPKVILFYGEKGYCTYISSANITISGYTRNLELVSKFYEMGIANEVIKYLKVILENCEGTASNKLAKKLQTLRINETAEFPNTTVLTNESEPIMTQFLKFIQDKTFNELYICSPYLDNNPTKVLESLDKIQVDNKLFILQTTNPFKIEVLEYFHNAEFQFKLYKNNRFLHAKFIYLHNDEEDYLLLGSANLSKQAMLKFYNEGNCEICVLLTIPSGEFKTNYLQFLQSLEYENTKDLNFEYKKREFAGKSKLPIIIESYIKDNKLNIELKGDYLGWVIYVFNSQNELVKQFSLSDCIIKEKEGYHKIIIKPELKNGIFRISLRKGSLESNISYFTTDIKDYIPHYSKEIYGGKNNEDINIPLLFSSTEREYYEIIGKYGGIRKYHPIKLIPDWRLKVKTSLTSLYRLLNRGMNKISEYFEKIYYELLDPEEFIYKIEDLVNWCLKIILSLPLKDNKIKVNLDLLKKFILTIAELNRIKKYFKLNLKIWKVIGLLIFIRNYGQVYGKRSPIVFFDLIKKCSISFKEKPKDLYDFIIDHFKREFSSELIKKIENEVYIDINLIKYLIIIQELYEN